MPPHPNLKGFAMRKTLVVAALLCSLGLVSAPFAAEGRIKIKDGDTVVLYGDSITEQNLYSAYIETFLISRLVDKDFRVYNFGWSGDTAHGGNSRFERDVMPVKPTLVFVNFGMNDGGYAAFNRSNYDWYMESQRALAETIKAAGARQVLLTTSPIEPHTHAYNEMLARMADGVKDLAEELGVPSADIFHPMLKDLRKHAGRQTGERLIPDSVHPGPAGHLLMAYYVLRELDVPGVVAEIEVSKKGVLKRRGNVGIEGFRYENGVAEFDLSLTRLPFYVPSAARVALDYVPFQKELNRFTLSMKDWPAGVDCLLMVDGSEAGSIPRKELVRGADLALLDGATWSRQGERLYKAAQYRWRVHLAGWRTTGVGIPGFAKDLVSGKWHTDASAAYVAELGQLVKKCARPGCYRVRMVAATEVEIPAVDLSPLYPWGGGFEERLPPETEPEEVKWRPVKLRDGFLDFTKVFDGPRDCAVFARVTLDAEEDCRLGLRLGSDDGIRVVANGEQVFANDVMRGYVPGADAAEADLKAGRNVLLFEVTQGGGGYSFGVKARVRGVARVRVVEP
jgi:lysophospholipase L1-like esterase